VQDPTDWIPQLTQDLSERLHAGGFGLRRMVLSVYRVDGEVSHVAIATARPTRDAAHMARLFDGKLDRLDPGYGFDLITLGAVVVEALETTQNTLDGDTGDDTDTDHLIDRLTARFGAGAIRRPAPKARHIPERAEDWRPAMAGSKAPPPPAGPERPLRLLEHPEEIRVLYAVPEGPPAQFVWRKQTHRVTRFAGPERIAPEWWVDRPGTRLRDYYKVEDHSGLRLWLYREGVLGDDRGQTPRWFLHGMFG
jgi:protein ImuB